MALTKIGSIGINTGIAFAGVTTIATLNASDNVLSVGGTVNFVSDVSIGGTVSIAGTLTYEDVTNVDAVGLITARDGIKVGSGITLSVDGDGFFTGVVTATSFKGDGSQLSNITSTTINNNANNRVITGSDTANTLEGEATLTYNGTDTFELQPASATPAIFVGDSNRTGAGQGIVHYKGNWNGTTVARITMDTGSDTTNKDDGIIRFDTAPSGSLSEAMRIDSSGNIMFGTTSSTVYDDSSGSGVVIRGATGALDVMRDNDVCLFLNRNTGDGQMMRMARAGTSKADISIRSDTLCFDVGSSGSERVRIDSDGDLTISDGDLIIGTSGHGIDFSATANASGSGASSINETLADYEQGDLTFTVTSSNGGSISYSYRTGHYTRVGNVCHVTGDIRFDGSWSGSNGDMYISLPYTAEETGGSVGGGIVHEWNLTSSSYVGLMIKVDNNESIARVTHHDGGNNNTGSFSTSNLGSSRYLKFEFTYQCQ